MSEIEKALNHIVASVLKSHDDCPASASTHLNQAIAILRRLAPDWKPYDDDYAHIVDLAVYEMRLLGVEPPETGK